MVKWLSEAKSVKLKEKKVQVNYIYTHFYGLSEIQSLVLKSLEAFGTWDDKPLNVWLCKDDEEWKEAHSRLISFFSSFPDGNEKRILEIRGGLRMVYSNPEIQRLLSKEKRTLQPNLLVHTKKFSDFENKIKKALIEHEISHKFEVDFGYFTPIQQVYFDRIEKYLFHPSYYRSLLYEIKVICDDISAEEVCIDFGLKDDVYLLSSQMLKENKKIWNKERQKNPVDQFFLTLHLSSYALPFNHKNEKTYEEKIRKVTQNYLKIEKLFDLKNELEKIMNKVRNPPQVSEMEIVYDEIIKKFEEFILKTQIY